MGGPALHVSYLSAGPRERGYETTLVAGSVGRGEQSMAYVAEELGVPVVTIPHLHREISPLRDLLATARLARIMRSERPTILHTHTAKAGAVGRDGRAARRAARGRRSSSTRSTATCCAATSAASGRASSGCSNAMLARSHGRARSRSAPRFATSSSRSASPPRRSSGSSGSASSSTRGSPAADAARAETRRVMGIPDGRFVVGWIGRMTGVKRADDVLRGFRALRDDGVDAVLCMVGDGPDRESGGAARRRARDRQRLPVHRLPGGRRPVLRGVRRLRPALRRTRGRR